MQLTPATYKAAIDLERAMYEMASETLKGDERRFFGEPPSLTEDGKYQPGKQPDIDSLKKTLESFLLY